MSSSLDDVVPHMNIRSPRLQPGKFLFREAKRLLQHYPPNNRHWQHERTRPFRSRFRTFWRSQAFAALNGGISIIGRPPTERNAQMFNGAFAKILEAQKITIRLLANFANRFDALDTQGPIHPRCELQLLNWHFVRQLWCRSNQ